MKCDIELEQQLAQLFPRPPYSTQLKLSTDLYKILNLSQSSEKIKVAILQSPTGTGKTYGILTALIKWLKQNPSLLKSKKIKQQAVGENTTQSNNSDCSELPPWLKKHQLNKEAKLAQLRQQKVKKMKTIAQYKIGTDKASKKYGNIEKIKENKKKIEWEDSGEGQEMEASAKKRKVNENKITLKIQEEEKQALPKIVFASRTHSQLAQVLQSVNSFENPMRAVVLASKDHLCVHPNIQKNKVHEKCQYLLSHGGCPYYHNEDLQDFLNVTIEDAKNMGTSHNICSYYGIKNVSGVADILCVPYISILNAEIRNKLGINLNNSIIVFDEAHNIIQQELAMKSPQINYTQLLRLSKRVQAYQEKYGNRMNDRNKQLIKHMEEVIKSIMNILDEQKKRHTGQEAPQKYLKMKKMEFIIRLNLTEIRLAKIKNYIALSNFDQKLAFFTQQPFPMSILTNFLDFISQMISFNQKSPTSNPQPSIVLIKGLSKQQNTSVKIMCLQSSELCQIIEMSRITVLAGGTMEPVQSITSILQNKDIPFKYLKYPHVIKKQQCKVYLISKNPDQQNPKYIKFTHHQAQKQAEFSQILRSVHQIISNIVTKSEPRSGTVVFIQNYQLLENMRTVFGEAIAGYRIYYDSKSQNNAFEQFERTILKSKESAILISVMGGKLSEGINFSDQLARRIIVLGLPYPNLKSPQIIEKMKYLNTKTQNYCPQFKSSALGGTQENEVETGQKFYENCCIKVLNQSIGRGIRHKNDYADIYLIDSRFQEIAHKLSSWLVNCIVQNK